MTSIVASDFPTWQSTLSVLAMIATGLGVYYMRLQTKSFQEQTELLRKQIATPLQITPQPLSVEMVKTLHEQFADKHEFQQHVRDNDKQRGVLHKRMDDAIKDYNEKFQSLPNEIVALLRNTGNLK